MAKLENVTMNTECRILNLTVGEKTPAPIYGNNK